MKKKKVSVPVAFAACWILLLLILNALKVPHHFRIGIYLNLLFILGVIGVSMFLQIREEKKLHSFAVNFKNSLKKSGVYVIVVTSFLFLYLKFINPLFLENLKNKVNLFWFRRDLRLDDNHGFFKALQENEKVIPRV